MKTGKVAKLFNRDANTISDWTERYTEFFTLSARAQGRSQRDYQPEDLIVLNTIRIARDQDNATWEEIRARLASGDLETALPAEALNIDGNAAITVYRQMKELEHRILCWSKRLIVCGLNLIVNGQTKNATSWKSGSGRRWPNFTSK